MGKLKLFKSESEGEVEGVKRSGNSKDTNKKSDKKGTVKDTNKKSDKKGTVRVSSNFQHYTEQICTFLPNTSVFLEKALRPRASRGGALLQRPKATTWQCPSFVNTSIE